MKWATSQMIHFDRVASAWLILRFVDKDAKFTFLAKGATVSKEVTLFGVPGARLAAHNGKGTTFQRILDEYSLNDAALAAFSKIAGDVVAHVLLDPSRACLASRDAHVAGILALAEGILLLSATDQECLERSLPLYDAFYTRLQAQSAIDERSASSSASVFEQTVQFAKAASVLRDSAVAFSRDAFSQALAADPSSLP